MDEKRLPVPPSAANGFVATVVPNGSTTTGKFRDEADAWRAFDERVELSGAFAIHREVEGDYVQPRPFTELKRARIDRILVPKQKAFDAGWRYGILGVEGKRSGEKLGPPLSQSLDYARCVFKLLPSGFLVYPLWVFLYPMERQSGPVESVMAQNRIGTAEFSFSRSLLFNAGTCSGVIHIAPDGSVFTRPIECGNKRGSR